MAVTKKKFLCADQQRRKGQQNLIPSLTATLPSKASKPKKTQWASKERPLNKLQMLSPDRASDQSRLF
jgi:hypothetical protein